MHLDPTEHMGGPDWPTTCQFVTNLCLKGLEVKGMHDNYRFLVPPENAKCSQ